MSRSKQDRSRNADPKPSQASDAKADASEEVTLNADAAGPSFSTTPLEPRILLSATWVEVDTDLDAELDDAAMDADAAPLVTVERLDGDGDDGLLDGLDAEDASGPAVDPLEFDADSFQPQAGVETPVPITVGEGVDLEATSVRISGLPEGTALSAGSPDSDGVWTVLGDDLAGLTVRTPAAFEGAVEVHVEYETVVEASPNLIQNGSFESNELDGDRWNVFDAVEGWESTTGTGIEVQGDIAGSAADGDAKIELDSHTNSGMAQSVSVADGESYQMSFEYSPRPGVEADSNGVEVYWDGELVATLGGDGVGLSDTEWQTHKITVEGAGDSGRVEFRAIGVEDSHGGYIDDVQMRAVADFDATHTVNVAPADDPTNFIANGSFEDLRGMQSAGFGHHGATVSGWQLEEGPRAEVHDPRGGVDAADDGDYWLDLDASPGNVTVSQQVLGLDAGKVYDLSFATADSDPIMHRGELLDTGANGLEVYWNGELVAEVHGEDAEWTQHNLQVRAGSGDGSDRLTFKGLGPEDNVGMSLDDVRMTANDNLLVNGSFEDQLGTSERGWGHASKDIRGWELTGVPQQVDFSEGVVSHGGASQDRDGAFEVSEDGAELHLPENSWKAVPGDYEITAGTVLELEYRSTGEPELAMIGFDNDAGFDGRSSNWVKLFGSQNYPDAADHAYDTYEGDGEWQKVRIPIGQHMTGDFDRMTFVNDDDNNEGNRDVTGNSSFRNVRLIQPPAGQFEVVDSGHRGVEASDGEHWLDMDASPGNIAISQHVPGVEDGANYQLSFDLADSVRDATDGLEVVWNGEVIATIDGQDASMDRFDFAVTGGSGDGSNTLSFRGTGDANGHGVSLDNVRLTAMEPSDTGRPSNEGDTVQGTDQRDRIVTRGGGDVIDAGGGNDWIQAGAGGDIINGGEGNDRIAHWDSDAGVRVDLESQTVSGGFAEGDRISSIEEAVGSNHDDVILGSNGDNKFLRGGGGDDVVDGRAGDDRLIGDAGNDTLIGGAGRDRLSGGTGDDTLDGGDGRDNLRGGDGDDTIRGGEGNDWIQGGAGADVIDGGEGNDRIAHWNSDAGVRVDLQSQTVSGGSAEGDRISGIEEAVGSNHDDVILGSDGDNKFLRGGGGDDVIDGRDGDDRLIGDAGNDTLLGGAGNDRLHGGTGDDTLNAGTGNNFIDGGDGNDTAVIDGRIGRYDIEVRGENVVVRSVDTGERTTIRNVENIQFANETSSVADLLAGSKADDTLTGDAGDNTLTGGAGNDTLSAGAGDDLLHGGSGDDVLDGGDGNDRLHGGSDGDSLNSGDDTLRGGAGDDFLDGNDGDDLLDGGADNDTLYGGNGNDTLRGGEGNDRLFGTSGENDLEGGAGDDLIVGGRGEDTARFSGSIADYEIVRLEDGSFQVTDTRPDGDGVDTVRAVESFAFADASYTADDLPIVNRMTDLGGVEGGTQVTFRVTGDHYDPKNVDDSGAGSPKYRVVINGETYVDASGQSTFEVNANRNRVVEEAVDRDGDGQNDRRQGRDVNDFEYVSLRVDPQLEIESLEIVFVNDAYDGTRDRDGDGVFFEDRNLIVDHVHVGGELAHDGSYTGGVTYEAEDPDHAMRVMSNGNLRGAAETMAWNGSVSFFTAGVKLEAPVVEQASLRIDGEDARLEVRGTASAYNRIELYDGDTRVGTTHADLNGNWSYEAAKDQSIGGTLRAVASNGTGETVELGDIELPRIGSGDADRIVGSDAGDRIVAGDGDDRVTGGAGDDTISVGSGDDRASGGDGDDRIVGGAGNDTLTGGSGNDWIDGGDGVDTARLSGNWQDYRIVANADGSYTLTDLRPDTPDGATRVTRVENFEFADMTLTASQLGGPQLLEPTEATEPAEIVPDAGLTPGAARSEDVATAAERVESLVDSAIRDFDATIEPTEPALQLSEPITLSGGTRTDWSQVDFGELNAIAGLEATPAAVGATNVSAAEAGSNDASAATDVTGSGDAAGSSDEDSRLARLWSLMRAFGGDRRE